MKFFQRLCEQILRGELKYEIYCKDFFVVLPIWMSHFQDILKVRQGKFICIAHFIHSGNSKCFT